MAPHWLTEQIVKETNVADYNLELLGRVTGGRDNNHGIYF